MDKRRYEMTRNNTSKRNITNMEYLDLIKHLSLFKNSHFKAWKTFLQKLQYREYRRNTKLIEQGKDDDVVYFLLRGSVEIIVNGQKHRTRQAGEHVGEIVALFPYMQRTAIVITKEKTLCAIMQGRDFRAFMESNPKLYMSIAETLAYRLEDRNHYIRPTNKKPIVFLGSSTKGKRKLAQIIEILKKNNIVVKPWTTDVFNLSKTTIENLEICLQECDFAILIVTSDDKTIKNGKEVMSPRDNIIFELGLAMGYLGRERTICLLHEPTKIEFPSDLSGVTYLDYKKKKDIISHIKQLNCR